METEGPTPTYTLDEGINAIGFGKFQYLLLAYAGLSTLAEAMELMLLSFIGSAIQPEWNLSLTQVNSISIITYIGMFGGSFLWGYISDHYGRKYGCLGASIMAMVFGYLSAAAPSFPCLLIVRLFFGIGLGGGHVFNTWYLEFIPAHHRGFYMVVFFAFSSAGTIIEALIVWFMMPMHHWRWLLIISSTPHLFTLVFYRLVPESPQYHCSIGELTKAKEVLLLGATVNGKQLAQGELVHHKQTNTATTENLGLEESLQSGNANQDQSIQFWSFTDDYNNTFPFLSPLCQLNPSFRCPILSSEWRRTTLLLWFLYFVNTFSYYGVILITTKLHLGSLLYSESIEDPSAYIRVLLTSTAEIPGLILAAVMLERVGRRVSMGIMFGAGLVPLLFLIFFQNTSLSMFLIFGTRMFIFASFIVTQIYAEEVYPTSMRATGVGLLVVVGNIGGTVLPLVAAWLDSIGSYQHTLSLLLFAVTTFLSIVCVCFLPIETSMRELE